MQIVQEFALSCLEKGRAESGDIMLSSEHGVSEGSRAVKVGGSSGTVDWTIAQIALPVRDVERAIVFYRDMLGMKYLSTGPLGTAFFDCNGVRLMLSGPERPEFNHSSSIVYFAVGDIEASYLSLRERGVHFFDKPHVIEESDGYAVWMAFFSDFDRNVLGLTSEVPKA